MKNNVKVQDNTQSLQSCVSVSVTDLRIGNLFTGYNGKIFEWDYSCFELCSKGIDVDEIGLPTTLTEEWLVKFGLGKNNGYPYKFLNGFIKIRNGIYFFKYYDLEVELPFVHSLQNLHYALKGCDLQIGNLTEH